VAESFRLIIAEAWPSAPGSAVAASADPSIEGMTYGSAEVGTERQVALQARWRLFASHSGELCAVVGAVLRPDGGRMFCLARLPRAVRENTTVGFRIASCRPTSPWVPLGGMENGAWYRHIGQRGRRP
jgi:hypothetical protein